MQEMAVTPHDATELAASFLQAAITFGLVMVCAYLYARYRKPYFALWALAWCLYSVRLGIIIAFLATEVWDLLFWHQVLTGWTALAFLASALMFAQRFRWRREYWILVLFPLLWSYIAIYRLDNFLLAAGPAVVFLSLATLWTGVVLWRHHRQIGSLPAALMAWAFFLWSLHHLDYPFLRARGAWNPWGYYLDIVFELAIGTAILLLVVEDQYRGLSVLSALSGDLQSGRREDEVLGALLARPLTLPGVRGSAIYLVSAGSVVRGAGVCAVWEGSRPSGAASEAVGRVVETGEPEVMRGGRRICPARPTRTRRRFRSSRATRCGEPFSSWASPRTCWRCWTPAFWLPSGTRWGPPWRTPACFDGWRPEAQIWSASPPVW
jgi:hypothetical protein